MRGGADTIEHGFLDDEAVAMILERDAFYVPTISCTQDQEWINSLPEFQIKKARGAAAQHRESVQKAMRAGVKIACGSDSSPIAEFSKRELKYLVEVGMSEMDALIARRGHPPTFVNSPTIWAPSKSASWRTWRCWAATRSATSPPFAMFDW